MVSRAEFARMAPHLGVSAGWLWCEDLPAPTWATADPDRDWDCHFAFPARWLIEASRGVRLSAREIASANILPLDHATAVLRGHRFPMPRIDSAWWAAIGPVEHLAAMRDQHLRSTWLDVTRTREDLLASYRPFHPTVRGGATSLRTHIEQRLRLPSRRPAARTTRATLGRVDEVLTEALQQRGATWALVGQIVGMAAQSLARAWRRTRGFDLVYRIATALHIDPDWLWSGHGRQPPSRRPLAGRSPVDATSAAAPVPQPTRKRASSAARSGALRLPR